MEIVRVFLDFYLNMCGIIAGRPTCIALYMGYKNSPSALLLKHPGPPGDAYGATQCADGETAH